ncbi:MAG TPA: hypothetical protein VHU19_09085 [Pyrinomonadaceae bacterium]|jgi:hypothetical protein|nr:hypothetical protein [Pyrinomonadaceae bacterium]
MDEFTDARTEERAFKLREFFELGEEVELLAPDAPQPERRGEKNAGLDRFNIEWHIIPRAEALRLDDAYFSRLYPRAPRDFTRTREHKPPYRDVLARGHALHQGRVVGVEATEKPRYLPGNRQFYGSAYGHDPSADPFAVYLGRAAMVNGTRYDHNFLSLREFVRVVNEDWRARRLMPAGYRATVCPPAVFNLVGALYHPEWSETETLELGFYRDEAGNATCYAVGSNAPGDFSYIAEVEGEAEWSLAGFRVALVPE